MFGSFSRTYGRQPTTVYSGQGADIVMQSTAGDQRESTAKKGRHQRDSTPKPELSGEENLVEDGGWRVFFAA